MEIIKQKSSQIILLPHEQIPFALLANKKYTEIIIQRYSFGQVNAMQDPNGALVNFMFSNGLYQAENSPSVAINRLMIEERKVTITIEGNTNIAELIWGELRQALCALATNESPDFLVPILVANESDIMVHLDFVPDALFSSPLNNFVQRELVEKTSSELATSHITSPGASFTVDYMPETKMLNDRRINITRKEFTIKIAIGYPADQQIYSSSAPLSTDVHVTLLQQLDNNLKSK